MNARTDRMLVVEARRARMPLLTRDQALAAYREHITIRRHPEA
jgi:PIN domain nuclease of toxin-antitoxin system